MIRSTTPHPAASSPVWIRLGYQDWPDNGVIYFAIFNHLTVIFSIITSKEDHRSSEKIFPHCVYFSALIPPYSAVVMTSTIISLPPEIVHNILKYVNPIDLARVSRTCRVLHRSVAQDHLLCKKMYCRVLVSLYRRIICTRLCCVIEKDMGLITT